MTATAHRPTIAVFVDALVNMAACIDNPSPTSPSGRGASGPASFAVARTSFDVPVAFDGYLDWLACVDPNDPPFAHVIGGSHFSIQTTPGGVTTTSSPFDIDRDQTWVIYKGVTYHIAPGRPGKDDIVHTTTTPRCTACWPAGRSSRQRSR